MPGNDILGIVGSDGIVPIYNPESKWSVWSINDIFLGLEGDNKYVPKVRDYVFDEETYTTYIVDSLDPITLIPSLREIRPVNMSFSFSETDVLFGVGPGTQADTYRIYYDKSVIPYVLAADARLYVGGSMTSYAKIFKGSVLNSAPNVISKTYDNSGNYISENVNLELAAIDNHNNYSIKTMAVCHTTEDLRDGEVVTAVFYSDQGHVVSKRQLLIEESTFIRGLNTSTKYITHISLKSPFLSITLDHVIEYPLNIPINALNLIGVAHYSDGTTLELPVDGTKFSMHGLNNFISTIPGDKVDLVLSYSVSESEVIYAGVMSDHKYITEPYQLIVVNPNNSYAVKLFGYPEWVDVNVGYVMKWWLFNLDRNLYFDVTPWVRFDEQTGAFNPKGYGYVQRKSVSLNLKDVSASFKAFRHVQLVEISLNGIPGSVTNPWLMANEVSGSRPAFGSGLFAKKINNSVVNVSSGIHTYEEWLERTYHQTFPLVNRAIETTYPTPNRFIVTFNNTGLEFTMDKWNLDLNIGVDLPINAPIEIRFIKRTSSGDLQLSMASIMLKH